MNLEDYKEMCSKIYEGEDWARMINCLERKDKEIERLNNIINECANDIFGVALAIRKKLLDYKELKGIELTENDKKQVKWLKEEFNVGVVKYDTIN